MSETTELIKYPHAGRHIHPTIGRFTRLEIYNGTLNMGVSRQKEERK